MFASGRSTLLIATTIGTSAARACEIDSLRLRHHAVVGRDDEHGDVRDLRAAGAHGGERLVAGRVEEGELPAVVVDLVGADVLRDPAGLGLDHRGLADRVQQRRLAVVDVPHDRHDRRPRLEVGLLVLVHLRLELLLGGVLDPHLAADVGGDQLDLLVGERLRHRLRRAEAHQERDQLRHRHAERLREVLDGDPGLDGHRAGGRRDRGLVLRLRLGAVAGLPAVLARARCARVDHDAALAAPGRRPLTGPDRAVGPVRTVSHRRQCRAVPALDRAAPSAAASG